MVRKIVASAVAGIGAGAGGPIGGPTGGPAGGPTEQKESTGLFNVFLFEQINVQNISN